jgi:hypothetical protein
MSSIESLEHTKKTLKLVTIVQIWIHIFELVKNTNKISHDVGKDSNSE